MAELRTDKSDLRKIRTSASLFMGLAHLLYLKDYLKGILFALCEVAFICFLPFAFGNLFDLVTLGTPHPGIPIKLRDNSLFMMIDGILTLTIIAVFVVVYVLSVRSAESTYEEFCRTGRFKNQKESFNLTMGKSFPLFGLAPAFVMVVVFVVVPLLFSVLVAFTNYSAPAHIAPNNTIDWVGFKNFASLIGGKNSWSSGFARVALWTLVWAVMATVTCYLGGLVIAVQLKEIKFRISPLFRFIFILPYAVPNVVSMLVWKNLLNGTSGIINRTLIELGLIHNPIPWLSDPLMAQVVCILVNLWAGFGYFMLLAMGTMTAISEDMYEAARIDGANRFDLFKRITLPLVLYQTLPLIIMSFAHNVNNFGAIYFLTNGAPTVADSTTTMAGGTDILVTWIYKLTMDLQQYHYASVVAVMIFIVLAPFAIWQFKQTKAYKEGSL